MKQGFTMAEVLITLGVIGIVAAMTIPNVVKKYKEHVTVNKVKKVYAIISQAYLLSVNDNGPVTDWNVEGGMTTTAATQMASYLKPYLKLSKDCGTKKDLSCLNYSQKHQHLNGDIDRENLSTDVRYYRMILMDGTVLSVRSSIGSDQCNSYDVHYNGTTCGAMFFDINGSKEPNTVGKDIFMIFFTPTGLKTRQNDCDRHNTNWGRTGAGCITHILEQGNMSYLYD